MARVIRSVRMAPGAGFDVSAYYNEFDPFAAAWLRKLIAAGLIAAGDVDERSIADVRASDLVGYQQCHFFAGIGGWSYALRLAGWPDERPVWTGSCPCQPGSRTGKRKGFSDGRHLWPIWARLIEVRRPPTIFGEQVADWTDWLRLVRGDLGTLDYAVGAMPIQAASAGADHRRDRFWFVASDLVDAISQGPQGLARNGYSQSERAQAARSTSAPGDALHLADPARDHERRTGESNKSGRSQIPAGGLRAVGGEFDWVVGADGKSRRIKPGIRLLAHGVSNRVGKLRGFGNAIDPRPAAAFIAAAAEAIAEL
jgi:DNA (cytosine-5)-methyltransferase 1